MMYIVRFIRRDGKPNEDYFYRLLKDAEYHFHLFDNDDSELYKTILLIFCEENQTEEINKHVFKL